MLSLSEPDLKNWTQALKALPAQVHELLPWIEGPLRKFFPFARIFMAHGELVAGQIKATHWLASGHEDRYLRQIATTFELAHRGSMQWWFLNRQPFTIDPEKPPPFASDLEVSEILTFNLQNVAAHGVLNSRSNAGTYFSFAGVPTPLTGWHLDALRLLAPVLNDLYLSYIAMQTVGTFKPLDSLTSRQKDIVRQVAAGKDDKTVGRLLGISEKTVRNQLTVVYAHLGISKRTQLLTMLH
jgi:DNA-binding CsgD family transcriptional regulator